MADYFANHDRAQSAVEAWDNRRAGRSPKQHVQLRTTMTPHLLAVVRAEAKVRRMSTSAFVRAMIRGYFGAA